MKESDYIVATNLAKLRIALNVVSDTLPVGPEDDKIRRDVLKQLSQWISKLEREVMK